MLMRDVCFIADVAVLPRWMRVSQALDYVAGVHPRFDRAKAESFLARTTIHRKSKVRELSKGMVAQLHLALVMAIDARLLVLDEPFEGVDPVAAATLTRVLRRFAASGGCVLLSSHAMALVEQLCDTVAVMAAGRVVAQGQLEQVRCGRSLEEAFMLAGADAGAGDGLVPEPGTGWCRSRGRTVMDDPLILMKLTVLRCGASGPGPAGSSAAR